MDAHHRPLPRRLTVLLVLFLFHGSLILVFLREKPAYVDHLAGAEVLTTVFFIDPKAPAPIPQRPTKNLLHQLPPATAISVPDDITAAAENQPSAASPPVDWLEEAHRSAADIISQSRSGAAAPPPPSATTSAAPWDSRPVLKFTGHGLEVRIPVEIPGKLIDHCFGKLNVDHEQQTGQREQYQLGYAFGKQPARSDLFDSLRKAPDGPK